MRDKDGAQTRHGEGARVKALFQIDLVFHLGDAGDEGGREGMRMGEVYFTALACAWKGMNAAQRRQVSCAQSLVSCRGSCR